MPPQLEQICLDYGLDWLTTHATTITLNSSEPTSYALAMSCLAFASFPAGSCFTSPAPIANGEAVTSAIITAGTAATNGVANWWAVCDGVNQNLLAHGTLTGPLTVYVGIYTMGSFSISIPAH
jgi:hypothetical protein